MKICRAGKAEGRACSAGASRDREGHIAHLVRVQIRIYRVGKAEVRVDSVRASKAEVPAQAAGALDVGT
jgi:hypothetical protein